MDNKNQSKWEQYHPDNMPYGEDFLNDQDHVLVYLPTDIVQPGKYQPRKHFDEADLDGLVDSIREQGVIQPIIVRNHGFDLYEIIAGERRWRAAKKLGLSKIPAIVYKSTEFDMMIVALVENIQRKDLNAIEEAVAIKHLQEKFTLTQEEVAVKIGRSRAAVSNILRLLDLHSDVREWLTHGKLDMGHARALLPLTPEQQVELGQMIIDNHLSVRDAEKQAKKCKVDKEGKVDHTVEFEQQEKVNEYAEWETLLTETLGGKVAIKQMRGGKFKVTLGLADAKDLEKFIGMVSGKPAGE